LGVTEVIDVEIPFSVIHHSSRRTEPVDEVLLHPPLARPARDRTGVNKRSRKHSKRQARAEQRERKLRLGDRSLTCACCTRRALSEDERKRRKRQRRLLRRALKASGFRPFSSLQSKAFKLIAKKTGNGELTKYLKLSKGKRRILLTRLATELPAGPYVLAGHSMGSVVALELAALLPAHRQPVALMTFGAPLDWRYVRKHLLKGVRVWAKTQRDFPWLNVRDKDDIVTKCESLRGEGLGPIVDIKVVNHKSAHSASGYLAHVTPYAELLDLVRAEVPAGQSVRESANDEGRGRLPSLVE
jgi:hypothetical protein